MIVSPFLMNPCFPWLPNQWFVPSLHVLPPNSWFLIPISFSHYVTILPQTCKFQCPWSRPSHETSTSNSFLFCMWVQQCKWYITFYHITQSYTMTLNSSTPDIFPTFEQQDAQLVFGPRYFMASTLFTYCLHMMLYFSNQSLSHMNQSLFPSSISSYIM